MITFFWTFASCQMAQWIRVLVLVRWVYGSIPLVVYFFCLNGFHNLTISLINHFPRVLFPFSPFFSLSFQVVHKNRSFSLSQCPLFHPSFHSENSTRLIQKEIFFNCTNNFILLIINLLEKIFLNLIEIRFSLINPYAIILESNVLFKYLFNTHFGQWFSLF